MRLRLLPREQVALALLERELSWSKRLLDVGCGEGTFLRALGERFDHLALSGVEMSETQAERARTLVSRADVRLAVADEGLPFADASFDLVYSGEVIEHVYDPDAFARECARVLAPGGILVLSTPNFAAWFNRVLLMLGQQPVFYESSTVTTKVGAGITARFRASDRPVGHVRLFTTTALRDLLELHGFTCVEGRGAPFHALRGLVRRLDDEIARLPSLASIQVVKARVRGRSRSR